MQFQLPFPDCFFLSILTRAANYVSYVTDLLIYANICAHVSKGSKHPDTA